MCSSFILCIFAALLFKKYDMFKNIEQQLHQNFVTAIINGAFTVELGIYIFNAGIDYWIYGHSHRNIDAQIGDTQILSNQLGYISHGEHIRNDFSAGRYIEV